MSALWFWAWWPPNPATQVLRPQPVADDVDEERVYPAEKVAATEPANLPTLILGGAFTEENTEDVFDARRRALGRKLGAKKRYEDAQLPAVILKR